MIMQSTAIDLQYCSMPSAQTIVRHNRRDYTKSFGLILLENTGTVP